jgi:hypothetical protein
VRAWLDRRLDAFRAHQYFNLLALSLALLSLLLLASEPGLFWPLLALASLTPVLWFTTYASTETFVFSLGVVALACRLSDRVVLAIFFTSLAAMQYQPLALLSAFLCVELLWQERLRLRERRLTLAGVVATAALVFVPSAFYAVHFRNPNLLAREGYASVHFMSVQKFLGLFVDLNGGLLVFAPGVLLMLLVAAGWAIARARTRDFRGLGLLVAVLLTMVASTVQRNWNHPTFGISRYALYAIAPALMFIGTEIRARGVRARLLGGLCVVALALQVAVHRANGWFEYHGNDANHHSPIAIYVLEHWPWLYNPHSEIFCERTTDRCWPDLKTGETSREFLPVAYLDKHWTVHKIMTACHETKLLSSTFWSADQRARIQVALQRCHGDRPVYINF